MLAPLLLSAVLASHAPPSSDSPRVPAAAFKPTPQISALNGDWLRDGTIAGGSWLLFALSETALKPALAPATCRWCDRAADGTDTLNGLDAWGRGARWKLEDQRTASTLSDIADFAVVPAVVIGADILMASDAGALRAVPEDLLILIEAAGVSSLLNQVVKFSAGRERPFVHVLPEAEKGLTERPTDNNLSFYSGHTQLAFSLTVAAGTIAELRGYPNRWLIWAVGLPFCVLVPYLRMAADKHYLTDVLAGALIGSAVGLAIPLTLHSRIGVTMAAGPGGVAVAGKF